MSSKNIKSDNRRSDNIKSENRRSDNRRSDNRRSDNRRSENMRSDDEETIENLSVILEESDLHNFNIDQYKDHIDYIDLFGEIIDDHHIDQEHWLKMLPYAMEIVEKNTDLSGDQKEDIVFNICGHILVNELMWVTHKEYQVARMAIRTVIDVSRGSVKINRSTSCFPCIRS